MKKRKRAMRATYALIACMLCLVGFWRADALPESEPSPAPPSVLSEPSAPSPPPSAQGSPTPSAPPAAFWKGDFELPIEGSTGYATIALNLRASPDANAERLRVVDAGTGFSIVREEGAYWYVAHPDFTGYLAHRYCMINLPDILPSIVYQNTNASASVIHTSGKRLPGVTDEKLYDSSAYNARLEKDAYIMPVLYVMAKKISAAQRAARSQGDSLKIYEAYRPYGAQRRVVDALEALAGADADVQSGINTTPWKEAWFASQGISNHQRGCAIDVSLVKVQATREQASGDYAYLEVAEYAEYDMPTPMHELSIAAAAFQAPVSSSSKTAWRAAAPAATMNDAAKSLQKYCVDAGLTPLASEWWHFNDLDAYESVQGNAGDGRAILTDIYSQSPPSALSAAVS